MIDTHLDIFEPDNSEQNFKNIYQAMIKNGNPRYGIIWLMRIKILLEVAIGSKMVFINATPQIP
jgi:hypothetical protein